jgi:Na+/proline symporter
MEQRHLSPTDYAVVGLSLVAALLVGAWQAFRHRGRGQEDLLVAEGMSVLPVALSLVASYLSGILIVGMTSILNYYSAMIL